MALGRRGVHSMAARPRAAPPGILDDHCSSCKLCMRQDDGRDTNYRAQGVEQGQSCVIEVIPEQAEFLNDPQRG